MAESGGGGGTKGGGASKVRKTSPAERKENKRINKLLSTSTPAPF